MYCKSKRLWLTRTGLFAVHLVSSVLYVSLAAFSVVGLFSDVTELRGAAFLAAIFLADRALHIGAGDRTLEEVERRGKGNVAPSLASPSYYVLINAINRSRALHTDFFLETALLLAKRGDVREILRRLGISPTAFISEIEDRKSEIGARPRPEIVGEAERLAVDAYGVAKDMGEKYVEPRNLFSAVWRSGHPVLENMMLRFDITERDVFGAVIFAEFKTRFRRVRRVPQTLGGFAVRFRKKRRRVMNRAWTARPTPYLDSFGADLTNLARRARLGFLIGHRAEFDALLRALSRPGKPNALLIGAPGVGKSSIIAHLAFRIVHDEVPEVLFDKRLISLDVGRLVANASAEEAAGRLRRIADEIISAGNIVLVLSLIHI